MFEQQKPSIRFSMVGFGQAGSRIANEFGKFKFNEETAYNVFAFNSTSRDFSG
ncbi:cell division protein FtsZ, partial [Bacillus toyonensis]